MRSNAHCSAERKVMNLDKHRKYVAACYCRLSQDDAKDGTSVSIETQRKVLDDFCHEHNIYIYQFYCDDGFTGTNFQRPNFSRMMKDVYAGKANVIIVKDLSRFGRDYVGVGNYLQLELPENDINFISVADNVEVSREKPATDDLMIPLKNVFNEYYPAECSMKVRQAMSTKAKSGEFIGSQAPFGYVKSPHDKHVLIIDEETAGIVKEIFEMTAYSGYGFNKIANILWDRRVMTPAALQAQRSGRTYSKDPYRWNLATVSKLLDNTVYLGTLISGKRRKLNYKSKKIIKMSEDKWIVNENMHEPIIPRKLWDDAHTKMASRKRRNFSDFENIFAGLLKCDCCGYALGIANAKDKNKYYTCNTYKKQSRNNPICTIHYTLYDELYACVLDEIQTLVKAVNTDEEAFRSDVHERVNSKDESDRKSILTEIGSLEKQVAALEKKYDMLYDDRVNGVISENKFREMSSKCESEQIRYTEKLTVLKDEISRMNEQDENVSAFIDMLKTVTSVESLDSVLLNTLIDKIVVSDRKKDRDGTVHQTFTIYYKFLGCCC